MTVPKDTTADRSLWGRLRRTTRLAGQTALTLAVIGGAGLAVQIGAGELTRRAEASPAPESAPAIPVATLALRKEAGYDIRRAFVGQIEPRKTVAMSFELSGRLISLTVDEGDTVSEGQIIAALDTAILEAEESRLLSSRSAAAAQLIFAEQTLERNGELKDRGFATQAGFDGALAQRNELVARIAEIDAALRNVAVRIGKSQIQAPFDGVVAARNVDGGEALGPGQTVVQIVELKAPQVRVGVPLDIDETTLRTAEIELDGTPRAATLVALRPDVDPITRARTAIFTVDLGDVPVFGQTARLVVSRHVEAEGLWLPVASLKEGLRGQWTALTVDPDDRVRSASVEILHAESDRVFVRGAFPDGTRLIAAGPHRVAIGQSVIPTPSE